MELNELIEEFKKNNSQENYNRILKELFTKCENILLWLETKPIENGLTFRHYADDNGKKYLLANTKEFILNKESEMLTHITVKGIFEIVLTNDCNGLIINLDDSKNQFILLKDDIVKIFTECS